MARRCIILEVDLSCKCRGCARNVKNVILAVPGVEDVSFDRETNRVEVTGTADATVVVTSTQIRARKNVRIISNQRIDGTPAESEGHVPSPSSTVSLATASYLGDPSRDFPYDQYQYGSYGNYGYMPSFPSDEPYGQNQYGSYGNSTYSYNGYASSPPYNDDNAEGCCIQ